MPNIADVWTEIALQRTEKKIRETYSKASKEMLAETNAYFNKFLKRDEEMKDRLDAGEITEDYYKQWRLNQMGRGQRMEAMTNKLANNMYNSDVIANQYVNGAIPGVYATNRNYGAYEIESVGNNIGFTLYDEATVKRLIKDNPQTMPSYPTYREIERGIDVAYSKKQITNAITSGILQGKSIKGIKDDLVTKIVGMNQASAIRAARTAVTSAQNGGRQDSYEQAQKMGIKIQKEWMCTLDDRTRLEHRLLDGQRVDINDKFQVIGYRLEFPGDPRAEGCMVYNCRCTMVSYLPEIEGDQERITYKEWEKQKMSEESETPTEKITTNDLSDEIVERLKEYTDGEYNDICQYSQYLYSSEDLIVSESVYQFKGYTSKAEYFENEIAKPTEFYGVVTGGISEADKKISAELLDVISKQPENDYTLYRLDLKASGDETFEEGQTLNWGIRSTSRDDDFVDKYFKGEEQDLTDKEFKNDGSFIEYRISNAKSLDISDVSVFEAQQEELVAGSYKVVKTEVIKPEQRGLINVPLKDVCDYEEFTSKKGNEMVRYTQKVPTFDYIPIEDSNDTRRVFTGYKTEEEKTMTKSRFLSDTTGGTVYQEGVLGRTVVWLEYDEETSKKHRK